MLLEETLKYLGIAFVSSALLIFMSKIVLQFLLRRPVDYYDAEEIKQEELMLNSAGFSIRDELETDVEGEPLHEKEESIEGSGEEHIHIPEIVHHKHEEKLSEEEADKKPEAPAEEAAEVFTEEPAGEPVEETVAEAAEEQVEEPAVETAEEPAEESVGEPIEFVPAVPEIESEEISGVRIAPTYELSDNESVQLTLLPVTETRPDFVRTADETEAPAAPETADAAADVTAEAEDAAADETAAPDVTCEVPAAETAETEETAVAEEGTAEETEEGPEEGPEEEPAGPLWEPYEDIRKSLEEAYEETRAAGPETQEETEEEPGISEEIEDVPAVSEETEEEPAASVGAEEVPAPVDEVTETDELDEEFYFGQVKQQEKKGTVHGKGGRRKRRRSSKPSMRMNKSELISIAESRGIEIPEDATKKIILDLIYAEKNKD